MRVHVRTPQFFTHMCNIITLHGAMQVIVKKLGQEVSESARDSLSKTLYQALFLWVVSTTNETLSPPNASGPNKNSWIGILDVFGFECFERNSFEQFCINFANERLQQVREERKF